LSGVLVLVLVNCVREQRRNSASFAQTSPSRLSESCRVSFLGCGSCFSPRRLVSGLSDQYSRLGERGLPKRGRDESCACWARLLVQARGFEVLSDWYSRLGENSRDETLVLVALNPRPGEEFCVLSERSLAQASRVRLSEMLWSSHWFILAQAR